MIKKQKVLLTILDGFGIAPDNKNNAISNADMPTYKYLKTNYPWVQCHASGEWVGLPIGQMGNSEVGHLHIGAGRVLYQSLTLINNAIQSGVFYKNETIFNAIFNAKTKNKALHVIGLLSDGGVHAHIEHIIAILRAAHLQGLKRVYVHAILDGRDTKKDLAKHFIQQLADSFKHYPDAKLSSISGRYYAMDRDQRWERLQQAYDVIVERKGPIFNNVFDYIDQYYDQGIYDEFIVPASNFDCPDGFINDGDSVIFANFRPDRAIQLASVLTNNKYVYVPKIQRKELFFVSMMKYSDTVESSYVIFAGNNLNNCLGEWISKNGFKQLRIAETEKIAHVTYFFDGGQDIIFDNEDKILIPSPKVSTYDLKPEMSAVEITNRLIAEIDRDIYDLIILNFANPDMVGHTGNFAATVKALETIDQCLKKIYEQCNKSNYTMVITADHGNAEIMIDETGDINKKHTSQLVPLIITNKNIKLNNNNPGLSNIAPTILELLSVKKPDAMTSKSLIIEE